MGESIAVIFIVIILLFVGIVFWNNVSSSNVRDIQAQSDELSVIEIANMVSDLPELKCSDAGVYEVKCLDLYKIKAMNQTVQKAEYPDHEKMIEFYHNYFKNARITVVELYPTQENITIYDIKTENVTKKLISVPVNIRDNVHQETSYGLIVVEGYYNER